MVKDPVLTDYVNSVGKRLATSREAQSSGFPFTFEVVADPIINAFAPDGGHMFIRTGLLRAVENEAQLAGVYGYETGKFNPMKAGVMKIHESKPQPQQQQQPSQRQQ